MVKCLNKSCNIHNKTENSWLREWNEQAAVMVVKRTLLN